MSAHNQKSKGRHLSTHTFERERFKVSHIVFEVVDHPKDGSTFALFVGDEFDPKRRPLFTGHITKGMGTELRKLAHRMDELED